MAPFYSPEPAMTEGLFCTCQMPLIWRVASLEPEARLRLMNEASDVLNALNQIETQYEPEASSPENRRLDRIEAKLNLTLHLLSQTLNAGINLNTRSIQLSPNGVQWPDPNPPTEGTTLIIELHPSEIRLLCLELPAIALSPLAGNARAKFEDLTETLDEALYQFIFRKHRQAIRAKTN
jgi:hypothetical protein